MNLSGGKSAKVVIANGLATNQKSHHSRWAYKRHQTLVAKAAVHEIYGQKLVDSGLSVIMGVVWIAEIPRHVGSF